jgi:O-acetyl-ADP-ribose deacetylase (regulator of RNase III)
MENKINVIVGNLIKDAMEYDAIAHGANCFCRMGAGIALGIKKTFPQAYNADLETSAGDIDKLGGYTFARQIWPDGLKRKQTVIFNLYSQYSHNASIKPLDYEALTLALRKYAAHARKNNWKVALPLIGYGLAGGDLNRIVHTIYFEMLGVDCDIIVYEGDDDAIETKKRVEQIINSIQANANLDTYIKRQIELLRY